MYATGYFVQSDLVQELQSNVQALEIRVKMLEDSLTGGVDLGALQNRVTTIETDLYTENIGIRDRVTGLNSDVEYCIAELYAPGKFNDRITVVEGRSDTNMINVNNALSGLSALNTRVTSLDNGVIGGNSGRVGNLETEVQLLGTNINGPVGVFFQLGNKADKSVVENLAATGEYAPLYTGSNRKLCVIPPAIVGDPPDPLRVAMYSDVTTMYSLLNGSKADKSVVQNLAATGEHAPLYTGVNRVLALKSELTTMQSTLSNQPLTVSLPKPLTSYEGKRLMVLRRNPLPSAVTPTHEWIVRPSQLTLYNTDSVQAWTDVVTGTVAIGIGTGPPEAKYVPATASLPAGVRKPVGVLFNNSLFWTPKGSVVMIHSFPVDQTGMTSTFMSSRNFETFRPNPNFIFGRGSFVAYHSGGQYIWALPGIESPPLLNKVYIVGLSWDFTITPPRITSMTHGRIDEWQGPVPPTNTATSYHIVPTENNTGYPSGVVELLRTEADLNTTTSTGLNSTNTNGAAALTFYGRRNEAPNVDVVCHYIGLWQNVYLTRDDMWTIRERMRQRYENVGMFSQGSYGVNDTLPTVPLV